MEAEALEVKERSAGGEPHVCGSPRSRPTGDTNCLIGKAQVSWGSPRVAGPGGPRTMGIVLLGIRCG